MLIGGLQKFSMIDYPNKLSAVVFLQGCNFVCPYCHNPQLNKRNDISSLSEQFVLDFLETRIGKLDAVVISGGEPTIQDDLIDFVSRVKKMGFLVKLDTNGTNPTLLDALLNKKLVDYVAMDIKAPLEKYDVYFKEIISINKIKQSIKVVLNASIDYEFRTTILKELLSLEEVLQIGKIIAGAERYYLQKFVYSNILDINYKEAKTYTEDELGIILPELRKNIKIVEIR